MLVVYGAQGVGEARRNDAVSKMLWGLEKRATLYICKILKYIINFDVLSLFSEAGGFLFLPHKLKKMVKYP